MDNVSRLSKVGVVLAGYAAALLVAYVVDYAANYFVTHIQKSPDASGGMAAFGDMLLFLGVFGVLALIPTALALYYLRPVVKFWSAFPAAALVVAATGPIAALMMGRHPENPWAMLAVGLFGLLKVLAAPLLGVAFVIFAVIAPTRRSRLFLFAAAGIEFAVCGYALVCLVFVGHWL
jgi:hypothetical protein